MNVLKGIRYCSAVVLFLYVLGMLGTALFAFIRYDYNYLGNPTAGCVVLCLGVGLWLLPIGYVLVRKGGAVLAISALLFFVVGAGSDVFKRINLEDRILNSGDLWMLDFENPISEAEKGLIASELTNEAVKIDYLQSLENFFLTYNTCMCGPGEGLVDESGRIVFTAKHGNELYINGFLAFSVSENPIAVIQNENR